MADYVTLLGAEDVRRAGSAMSSAAGEMQRAASAFESVMERHQRFMDDWLARFEENIDRMLKAIDTVADAMESHEPPSSADTLVDEIEF